MIIGFLQARFRFADHPGRYRQFHQDFHRRFGTNTLGRAEYQMGARSLDS